MRKINKPSTVPKKLQDAQDAIEATLLQKQSKFKWETTHYSDPIKKELKDLYHNKCGFCEVLLTEHDSEQKFTVEHYRPKKHYWWLGNEWTNLFPTCLKCNSGEKGSDFPLRYGEKKRVLSPVLSNTQLDRTRCKADCTELLAEQPYFLHPEIDEVENYFVFEKNGKIAVNSTLDNWEQSRAKTMIDKFLGKPLLEEKRKTHIEKLGKELEESIKNFLQTCADIQYDNTHLKLAFNNFFKKMFLAASEKSEFSSLGKTILNQFNTFFVDTYDIGIQELIQHTFQLFLKDNSI